MSDEEYIAKKRADRIYLSKSFQIGKERERDARYISRVTEDSARCTFDRIDDEIVLRATHNQKVQIKAVVTSDDNNIRQLTLQSFRLYKDGLFWPNEEYGINLHGAEITDLIEFVTLATRLQVPVRGKVRIDAESLGQFDIEDAAKSWIRKHPELIREAIRNEVTARDVIALAYRRKQLRAFERLLSEPAFFDRAVEQFYSGREESLWQAFFEKNRWIFGYGLFYLSAEGFKDRKLEQSVIGNSIAASGKRVDGLLRTRGRISSVCLVEIKKHRTPLLREKPYRPGVWQPSSELDGAVSQALLSVDGLEREFRRVLAPTDSNGNPTGEDTIVARPRSVVVCGSLSEFESAGGVSQERFRCFELYRRHLVAPEIVTFDELFERAKLIVEVEESEAESVD